MKAIERRRYFRIDDEMIVAWRELSKQEKDKGVEKFLQGDVEYPDPRRHYLALEADITSMIGQLQPRDPIVSQVLRLLNRKVNLISRGPLMNGFMNSILDETPQSVNISACGIAFHVEKFIAPKTDLQIELVLVPQGTYVLCYGAVINCEQVKGSGDKPYRINVDFSAIREDDREKLIQHIMQKELSQLQRRKKQG